MHPSPTSDMAYLEVSDPAFAEWVMEQFSVSAIFGGLSFDGPCPRCGHGMTNVWFHEIYRAPSSHDPAPSLSTVPMVCTCDTKHPTPPDGRGGCGAYWVVDVQ